MAGKVFRCRFQDSPKVAPAVAQGCVPSPKFSVADEQPAWWCIQRSISNFYNTREKRGLKICRSGTPQSILVFPAD